MEKATSSEGQSHSSDECTIQERDTLMGKMPSNGAKVRHYGARSIVGNDNVLM